MPRLTSPTGATVEVPKEKVAGLLARGFTEAGDKPAKSTPKKSTSK